MIHDYFGDDELLMYECIDLTMQWYVFWKWLKIEEIGEIGVRMLSNLVAEFALCFLVRKQSVAEWNGSVAE